MESELLKCEHYNITNFHLSLNISMGGAVPFSQSWPLLFIWSQVASVPQSY
jgi:hypothetical protein